MGLTRESEINNMWMASMIRYFVCLGYVRGQLTCAIVVVGSMHNLKQPICVEIRHKVSIVWNIGGICDNSQILVGSLK